MKEITVENYLIRCANARGFQSLKLSGTIRGFPDRTILGPGRVVAFAEIKRPRGGRRDPIQVAWIRLLKRFGFRAEFIKTKDEAKAFVDSLRGGGSEARSGPGARRTEEKILKTLEDGNEKQDKAISAIYDSQ